MGSVSFGSVFHLVIKLFTLNTIPESLLKFMSTAALPFHLFKTIGVILSAYLCCRCLNWAALWRRARCLWQQTELSRSDCRRVVKYAGARCRSSINMSRWLHHFLCLRSVSLSDFTTVMAISLTRGFGFIRPEEDCDMLFFLPDRASF